MQFYLSLSSISVQLFSSASYIQTLLSREGTTSSIHTKQQVNYRDLYLCRTSVFLEAGSKIYYFEMNNWGHSGNLMFSAKRSVRSPSQVKLSYRLKLFFKNFSFSLSLSLSLSQMGRIIFGSRIQRYIVDFTHEYLLIRIIKKPTS